METRAHIWAGWFVWGLLGATGALAVAGITARFLDLDSGAQRLAMNACTLAFAAVAVFALAVANSAATAMPVLLRAHKWAAFVIAVIVAVVTGLVSLAGAHLAWAVLSGQPDELPGWDEVHAAGLALAFVKPAQSFVIAEWALLAGDEDRANARVELDFDHQLKLQREANLHAERMARIASQNRPAEPAPASEPEAEPVTSSQPSPKRTRLKVVEKLAGVAGAAVLLATAGSQADAAQIASQNCPTEPASSKGETAGEPTSEARALARSLIAQGLGPRAVHQQTRVPEGTCKRWAADFKAGRWAA